MSEQAMKEFDKYRKELLEAQRDCAWCGKHCETCDELVAHITENHPKNENGVRV